MELRRGEVYLAYLPEEDDNCSIQYGLRPIVIMSNNKNNFNSDIIQYVPVTGKMKRPDLPVHKIIEVDFLKRPSMALCEQVQMKPRKSVEEYIKKAELETRRQSVYLGRLSYIDMCRISYGVAVHLGFDDMINVNRYQCAAIA